MKVTEKKSPWFKFGSSAKQERKVEPPQKAKCIHCYKEFKTSYGFHVACKACRSEEDYLRSFEWALALAGAKA